MIDELKCILDCCRVNSFKKGRLITNERDLENSRKYKEIIDGSSRNVAIFTGKALSEILRDNTMQKSFMTLAYLCDMMVGSEITPIQK